VQVPGSSAVLFVDDAKLDEILWMQIDEFGKQTGAVKHIPLGASVADLEGITYGDGYFLRKSARNRTQRWRAKRDRAIQIRRRTRR